DELGLATGARARHLAMADESGVPVVYLRTLEDSLALREHLTEGARIGIIGGVGGCRRGGPPPPPPARRRGDRPGVARPPAATRPRTRGGTGLRRPPPRARSRPPHRCPGPRHLRPRRRGDGRPRRRQRPRRRPPRGRGGRPAERRARRR